MPTETEHWILFHHQVEQLWDLRRNLLLILLYMIPLHFWRGRLAFEYGEAPILSGRSSTATKQYVSRPHDLAWAGREWILLGLLLRSA
jgi:hypothetical protein